MVWGRKQRLSDLPVQPFDEIRKRARILVIDDDEKAFPYKLLQKEGYNIQYWPRVDELRDLESGAFDVIVLDIYGVASKDISTNDGIGVLEHIKKSNPAQLVIAYSGQKYDFSQAAFWKLADDYLGKPSSLIDCKERIDALLKQNFNPLHYWNAVIDALSHAGVPEKKIQAFEADVVESIKSKSHPSVETIEKSLAIAHHTAGFVYYMLGTIGHFFGTPR